MYKFDLKISCNFDASHFFVQLSPLKICWYFSYSPNRVQNRVELYAEIEILAAYMLAKWWCTQRQIVKIPLSQTIKTEKVLFRKWRLDLIRKNKLHFPHHEQNWRFKLNLCSKIRKGTNQRERSHDTLFFSEIHPEALLLIVLTFLF